MLAFITTLRHPHNSADYGRVETLLQETLSSIGRQACNDYVVIIVGNRRPTFALPARTRFVQVEFPPPSPRGGPQTGMPPIVWDKGTKAAVGLVTAREFAPEYVMFVDADDFVHRDLAGFCRDHPGQPGWVVKRGWMYSRARNTYAPKWKLFRICGSTYILPLEAYAVPSELNAGASQHEIFEAVGELFENVLGEHRYALEWWRERGRELRPLPFRGTVYQVDTGENHSGNVLLGPGMPYHSRLARDFGIQASKGPASTVWSSIGPAALRPDMRLPARPAFLRSKTSYLADYTPPSRDCESA
ncbi:glycosyltransferase family 2 protein [Mycolicibacterium sp. S2-37]|uniref:glycosyltransferase family A protein n=1 Tax=Mycolicibacterium sp. S2-37 TaxID=2810297 RepID=UPI001A942997|nr:glycosyltransferase family A protein [Mycolicibacterium sp. S2-37]MBO0676220.1 glycosyltransferase family 2 protein [Mycolicibacterium sp. S2-37]